MSNNQSQSALADSARAVIDALRYRLGKENLESFCEAIEHINTGPVQRGPLPKLSHPSLKYLDALEKQIEDEAILAAVQTLDWGQVYAGGGIDPVLAEGMFAAQAAGTYGVFAADDVACGLFLLAPNVYYPLHTHQAREVYHCLAGQIDITHKLNETPFTLSANQSSETPSGRLHALRTHSSPVLLAYIWKGEISAPTWWWDQEAGHWYRTAWRRKPGESWKAEHRERVDENVLVAALE